MQEIWVKRFSEVMQLLVMEDCQRKELNQVGLISVIFKAETVRLKKLYFLSDLMSLRSSCCFCGVE